MLYGHRKTSKLCQVLGRIDAWLTAFCRNSAPRSPDDTAVTAATPIPRWETTDHSREYVPILAYSPAAATAPNLGVRETASEWPNIAQNVAAAIPHGT